MNDRTWTAASEPIRIEIGDHESARGRQRGVLVYGDVRSFAESFPPRLMRLLLAVAAGPPATAAELAAHLGRAPDRVGIDLMSLWGMGLVRPSDDRPSVPKDCEI